jgi:hypothetical protein
VSWMLEKYMKQLVVKLTPRLDFNMAELEKHF